MSQRIFLNLAQTTHESSRDWREVILIDDGAMPEQVRVLLEFFQQRQGSNMTHPESQPFQTRSVYLVPMRYRMLQGSPILAVTFSQDRARLAQGQPSTPIQPWTFNGQVAIRGHFTS